MRLTKPFYDKQELKLSIAAFLYFFSLMCAYFILRPVRDEMGIQSGVESMQWLFTGTFLGMLLLVPALGWLIKTYKRTRVVPFSYGFFTLNLLGFYFSFKFLENATLSGLFFIWVSIFNLFVISLFWSLLSDVFTTDQAKRLFAPIAAGGSIGAIVGPLVTTLFVHRIGVPNLLLVSGVFLIIAIGIALYLIKHGKINEKKKIVTFKSSIWDGFRLFIKSPFLTHIGLFILCYTTVSTFLYFEQARIVYDAYDSSEDRTSYFGLRDLSVNSMTLILQFFLTKKIIKHIGVTFCLVIVPLISVVAFLTLGFTQSVMAILIIQVLYRSLNHSIQKPAREILFTTMHTDEKYKSKNFIDTAVYRAGDAFSGWLFAGLESLVASLSILSFLAVPIGMVWAAIGFKTGKFFKKQTTNYEQIDEQIIPKKSA